MTAPVTLLVGDHLRIERRYLVDGVMTAVTDEGSFAGVQVVGSAEHIAIEDGGEEKRLRLFPLHAVAEITLVKPVQRAPEPETPSAPAWDPGVA